MKLTKNQRAIIKQLESGCYISAIFRDATHGKLVSAELLERSGKFKQAIRPVVFYALLGKDLFIADFRGKVMIGQQATETFYYTLDTEAWADAKPEPHGGKRPGAGSLPKPEGEAQKLHIPGHRWAAKDPTYQMLVKLTAKERKDCYPLLFSVCRDVEATPQQLALFAKIKDLEF